MDTFDIDAGNLVWFIETMENIMLNSHKCQSNHYQNVNFIILLFELKLVLLENLIILINLFPLSVKHHLSSRLSTYNAYNGSH